MRDERLKSTALAAYGTEADFRRPRRHALYFKGGLRYRKDHDRMGCYRPVTPTGRCR